MMEEEKEEIDYYQKGRRDFESGGEDYYEPPQHVVDAGAVEEWQRGYQDCVEDWGEDW